MGIKRTTFNISHWSFMWGKKKAAISGRSINYCWTYTVQNIVLVTTNFWCCNSFNSKMVKSRSTMELQLNHTRNVEARLHHVMVSTNNVPNDSSNHDNNFNSIMLINWNVELVTLMCYSHHVVNYVACGKNCKSNWNAPSSNFLFILSIKTSLYILKNHTFLWKV